MTLWEETFKIRSYQVDVRRQLRVSDLCQLMQETAWNHANFHGLGYAALMEKKLAWILSRQLLHIETFPNWNDAITVQTWSTGHDRLFWYRDYKILDQNQQMLGKATSTWFVIDAKNRRPQQVATYFNRKYTDNTEQMFPEKLKRIREIPDAALSKTVRVRYQDLDMNGHANNIRYVDWIVDSLSGDFLQQHCLAQMEINYLAEALRDDVIEVNLSQQEGAHLFHQLIRSGDRTELCRARTVWRRRPKSEDGNL